MSIANYQPKIHLIQQPFGASPEVVEQPAEIAEVSARTPVLITEQQVLFATAAALPLQPGEDQPTLDRGDARPSEQACGRHS